MKKKFHTKQSKQKLKKIFSLNKIIFFAGLILTIIICSKFFLENEINKRENKEDYSKNNTLKYSNFELTGTSWLSFRDIPELIHEYVHSNKTLDYGCGAGRSTRFLKKLGLDVVGFDISKEYIKQAQKRDKLGKYVLETKKNKIPSKNNTYDLVFSSHVLLMSPNKEILNRTVREMYRVTKRGGTCIIVTGSEQMHAFDEKWVSYETSFPENINPKSGDMVKVFIKDCGAVFHDYNWTNEDYLEVFKHNGFEIAKIHQPLGKKNEGYEWLSEMKCSPYSIYILKKL